MDWIEEQKEINAVYAEGGDLRSFKVIISEQYTSPNVMAMLTIQIFTPYIKQYLCTFFIKEDLIFKITVSFVNPNIPE